MLEGAERDGKLKPDSIIVEPTAATRASAWRWSAASRATASRSSCPRGMSEERKKLIRGLGAELILTPDEEHIAGAVERARGDGRGRSAGLRPQPVREPRQPRVHYEETAHELWRQMNGDIACFVAGVGSGGTLQGVGTFLKEHRPEAKIVAVEPRNVSALLGHEPGLHQIQGIGDGFVPAVLDVELVDEVIEVTDEDAIETTRQLGRDLGLLVGHLLAVPTSGPPANSPADRGQHRHRPARPRRALLLYGPAVGV